MLLLWEGKAGKKCYLGYRGGGVVNFCLCVANRSYSLKAQNTHNDLSAPTECRTACPIASFSDIIKSSTVLYTSHLNCLLYHTNFSQLSGLPSLPLIPWTLTSHISLHGRYRTLIDFQCKHWNGPAAFTEKNIDLLFFCLKMWAEERKKDKLRDGYWFHPVQIEGSTVPSARDFKGLYFDPNVTRGEEEVHKCVSDTVVLCDVITCCWTSDPQKLSGSKNNSFASA